MTVTPSHITREETRGPIAVLDGIMPFLAGNRLRMICLALSLLIPSANAVAETTAATKSIGGLVVVLVDEASIAATIEGSVSDVVVGEGDAIESGDPIVLLDDRKALLEESLAEHASEIATHQQTETSDVDAAQVAVAEQEQLMAEHRVRSELNRRRAANQLKVHAAEKSEQVAKNEWERAKAARENFADAISESEIESLQLAFQRCQLETREAHFQLEMAAIDVRLDQATAETLQWKIEAAQVELQAARSADDVLKLQAEIQRLKLELAQVASEDHQIQTPIDGTIVSISTHAGDWVRPGQIVARVIDRERLRAEGYVTAEQADLLRRTDDVQIVITQSDGSRSRFPTTRRFVSPEIVAVTGEVRVWIEFQNPDGIVYPGSQAIVEIR
ncbi:HlyD family secretion protein [Allorhodopirellula solitaria]|nr:HlyD family efflux transporter periplasmic adaptor subunit [Allorhodopirellula solitaria]